MPVLANRGNPLKPFLKEGLEQALGNIPFISKEFSGELFSQLGDRPAVIDIARGKPKKGARRLGWVPWKTILPLNSNSKFGSKGPPASYPELSDENTAVSYVSISMRGCDSANHEGFTLYQFHVILHCIGSIKTNT
jgi:hypothetical protein